jgi:3-deoxy-manno-octulosonate cytidylyltransferase (CMP-KDO synthetase)
MRFHVVIPARFASTRLPGKPLLDIHGEPMIQHVHRRGVESGAQTVLIATDDARIAETAQAFGATVCMTDPGHQSGTDRLAEVAGTLDWPDDDIVVNLQGDEPMMPPRLLTQVARKLFDRPEASVATLGVPLTDEQVFDSNAVKLVTDRQGMALYFSRAPIPWKRGRFEDRQADAQGMYRHLGLYAYRVGFLRRFASWEVAPIENDESLEQLRVLWQGERIVVEIVDTPPPTGIDTPEDYQRLLDEMSRLA